MMKMRIIRLVSLCATAVLTLALSYGVANACSDFIQGSQGSGYSCELSGEDSQYCYYNCTCTISMAQCENNMHRDGFEIEGIDY
ncbi:MAG: hypothetical protein QOH70_1935 [Blastocatellia bacterium]|jgi:hypothetical protein|nr:hypothetical protein [Blastocatellia bacterium]